LEIEHLLAYQDEAKKDLELFRDLQRRLALRVSAVEVRKSMGMVATDLGAFAGTTAVMASLEVSASHMEYVLDAVKTQLEASGPVLELVRKDDE
jgi:hypothetical protein